MSSSPNIFATVKDRIDAAVGTLIQDGTLPAGLDLARVVAEPPREAAHGDVATNAAMVLAKPARMAPRALADILIPRFKAMEDVADATVAGPGFINLRLSPQVWYRELKVILASGIRYGESTIGNHVKINVEYVSANPTGPMHAGHVRGAVIGDTLANLLAKAGYDVTREYYFNDAGTQVDVLARTAYLRYREALGEDIGAIPEGLYPGEYLKDVGVALAKRDGKKWLDKPESDWLGPVRDFSVQYIIAVIRDDLDLIGIHHQVFTNERELIENGTLDEAFKILSDKDLIYVGTLPPPRGKVMEDWEPTPLTLFRSSQFGDNTDRPLKKRDGTWAYIMPDIAYHYDKIKRGFALMINVLGTDHGGYLERLRPAVAALSGNKAELVVVFNNIVKVFKNGEPVKLSKRSGNLITLREMVEQVGAGAVRFFMLTRDSNSPLDFDFAKVVEKTRDNPVFYVQYAHARAHSVFRHARTMFPTADLSDEALAKADLALLKDPDEIGVLRMLAAWPRMVESAATAHEPHRLAFYMYDLASQFHALWNKGNDATELRFLQADDMAVSLARLALVRGVSVVIASGLTVFGVEPVEEMR